MVCKCFTHCFKKSELIQHYICIFLYHAYTCNINLNSIWTVQYSFLQPSNCCDMRKSDYINI